MILQQLFVSPTNDIFQRQSRNGPDSAHRLCREFGALREDLEVHRLKPLLYSDAIEPGSEGQRHRGHERDQGELPAEVKRDDQASGNAQDGDDCECDVRPEKLLQLCRIGGHESRQGSDRAAVAVKPGYRLRDDVLEILQTIS